MTETETVGAMAGKAEPPFVVCMCPTYGRAALQPEILASAVRDFLGQDYPVHRRSLLVLNDHPDQKLTCAAPGVAVMNMRERASSLGVKSNIMLDMARRMGADLVCTWDDDDTHLPHRVSTSVLRLGDFDYWNPGMIWFHQRGQERKPDTVGVMHNASIYRWGVLRYENTSHGHDTRAQEFAVANLRCSPYKVTDPADIFYSYNWGWSHFHLSAFAGGDMNESYRVLSQNSGGKGAFEIKV